MNAGSAMSAGGGGSVGPVGGAGAGGGCGAALRRRRCGASARRQPRRPASRLAQPPAPRACRGGGRLGAARRRGRPQRSAAPVAELVSLVTAVVAAAGLPASAPAVPGAAADRRGRHTGAGRVGARHFRLQRFAGARSQACRPPPSAASAARGFGARVRQPFTTQSSAPFCHA